METSTGTVSGALFTATAAFAVSRGNSIEQIADITGIDEQNLLLGWHPVPDAALRVLWNALAASHPGEAISLAMGAATPVSVFGPLANVAASAPDVRSALTVFSQYGRQISSGVEIDLDETSNFASFTRRHSAGLNDSGRTATMLSVVFLKMLRGLTGQRPIIESVELFGEQEAGPERYSTYFGERVVWQGDRPETAFRFPKELLDTPLISADPRVFGAGLSFLQSIGEPVPVQHVNERLGDLIGAAEACCRLGKFDAQSIARTAGVSVRTAQRIASIEGKTLSQLIDQARADLAFNRMTKDKNVSTSELAELCGYYDERSFRRAFERWTGQSPAKFRRTQVN
ncbi:MAG: AraC family transcriptional regulator ligand-binding domain-containing protein [Pseudomonadota bacterium]